ncbi:hypothetical protein QR77_24725 [Streptomyces sp. 150FB]|uniref:DUF397 domain-containing protein n=1 Tax=Streptomyces sp. 150FB TaxID=1576605 RepID=UPI00058908CE|nr:DUF397 domain-containing protein [Streptomyces sp. 150FB]KIF76229.1 hypothetical protein QR77_24725 [Streptomyces sp. 150FB]
MNSTPTLITKWVKSTYSGGEGGNCVEWAPAYAEAHGTVLVRDSKDQRGPVLMLTPTAFAGLVTLARIHA